MSVTDTPARRFAAYAGAILASILGVWVVWDLWKVDLRYPLVEMNGDVIIAQGVVFKGLTENSWVLDNPRLGAPFGLDMRDFPLPDVLILGSAKFLSLFTKNHVLIRNLIAIGSYPLISATSLYVMRRLGIRYLIALTASLLFSFLTFHHVRIGEHIFFGIGYFTIPFATLLSLELFDDKSTFLGAGRDHWIKWVGGPATWRATALCVVMGLTGTVYYPAFSCYLLMVAGVLAAFHNRSVWPWLRSLCMQGIVATVLVACLTPTLLHERLHGHSIAILRDPQAAEVYGLKIVQLILPGSGHRLDVWRHWGDTYNRMAPLVTENRSAYLGFIGIAGFLYLLFALLRGRQGDSRLHTLGVLNMAVLLLGTIGGFASMISFMVTDKIRSYNRISVYIAFFALLALALLAERVAKTRLETERGRVITGFALLGLLCFGLWDQSPLNPNYDQLKRQYLVDKWFVARIESRLPPNSRIFQYPYFPFPENGPVEQLPEYFPMIPYLHSRTLRWSYGAIKGRRADAWIASVASLPAPEAVENLALSGFSAIFVSRNGYGDHGAKLEESLKSLLGKPIVVSQDGDTSVYSLLPSVAALRAKYGPDEFRQRQLDALSPMYLAWRDGFYSPDRSGQSERAWCRAKGRFVIENPSTRAKHVVLDSDVDVAQPPANVRLRSDLFSRVLHVGRKQFHLSDAFDVPPGEHFIEVETDSRRGNWGDAILDPRVSFTATKLECDAL